MIRLILIGAAGYLLATTPELRERVLGTARDMLGRLSARSRPQMRRGDITG